MSGDPIAGIDWGWAGSAFDVVSGDLHVVVPFSDGVLVALVDGLGHGPEAAAAACAVVPVLEAHAGNAPELLVQRCHDALRKTRGAVMSLASLSTAASAMTWLGVGNIDGAVLHRDGRRAEALAFRAGVVGYQLPPLRASVLAVSPGDTLILATDGIRSGCLTAIELADSPQEIAESVLARFARRDDDAHVVVARYLGAPP